MYLYTVYRFTDNKTVALLVKKESASHYTETRYTKISKENCGIKSGTKLQKNDFT